MPRCICQQRYVDEKNIDCYHYVNSVKIPDYYFHVDSVKILDYYLYIDSVKIEATMYAKEKHVCCK